MQISMYKPNNFPDWEIDIDVDPPGHIWFIYYWNRGPASQFNRVIRKEATPENPTAYPQLAKRLESFDGESDGPTSYVAFRPSTDIAPSGFFLRSTDTWGVWHYRWSDLPDDCDISVQKQVQGGPPPKGAPSGSSDNLWTNGRLRAVVFGFGDSWVLYRGRKIGYGGLLHIKFRRALEEGRKKKWTINVSFRL
jgi:hypothetical protein